MFFFSLTFIVFCMWLVYYIFVCIMKYSTVSCKEFEDYILKNNLRRIDSEWFMCYNYVDVDNNIKAMEIHNSWGNGDSYRILDDGKLDTLNLVNNIINNL